MSRFAPTKSARQGELRQSRGSGYDDDGETFDYEKGEFSWTQLTAAKNTSGAWSGTVTPDANGRKWHYSDVKWTFMRAP